MRARPRPATTCRPLNQAWQNAGPGGVPGCPHRCRGGPRPPPVSAWNMAVLAAMRETARAGSGGRWADLDEIELLPTVAADLGDLSPGRAHRRRRAAESRALGPFGALRRRRRPLLRNPPYGRGDGQPHPRRRRGAAHRPRRADPRHRPRDLQPASPLRGRPVAPAPGRPGALRPACARSTAACPWARGSSASVGRHRADLCVPERHRRRPSCFRRRGRPCARRGCGLRLRAHPQPRPASSARCRWAARPRSPSTSARWRWSQATADQIGIALDNARLYSETRRQLEELKRPRPSSSTPRSCRRWASWPRAWPTRSTTRSRRSSARRTCCRTPPTCTRHVRDRLRIIAEEAVTGGPHRAEPPAVRAPLPARAPPVLAGRAGPAGARAQGLSARAGQHPGGHRPRRLSAGVRRREPAPAGAAEPGAERSPGDGPAPGKRVLTLRVRADEAVRRRSRSCDTGPGIAAERAAQDLRSVLHDQAAGRGQRPGPVRLLRHRDRAPGPPAGREPAGRRGRLHRRAAGRRDRGLSVRRVRPVLARAAGGRRSAAGCAARGRAGARRARPPPRARLREPRRRLHPPASCWARTRFFVTPDLVEHLLAAHDRASPRAPTTAPRCAPTRTEPTVTWVGHATLLIQLDGVNVLTDPQWSERASPVTLRRPPARHAARAAVRGPAAHPRGPDLPRPLRPPGRGDGASGWPPSIGRASWCRSGLKAWFADLGITDVEELDWWEQPHGARAHPDLRARPALLGPHALGPQPPAVERLGDRRAASAACSSRGTPPTPACFKEIGAAPGTVRPGRDRHRRLPAARHHAGHPHDARGGAPGLRRRPRAGASCRSTGAPSTSPTSRWRSRRSAWRRRAAPRLDPERVWILKHGETRRW